MHSHQNGQAWRAEHGTGAAAAPMGLGQRASGLRTEVSRNVTYGDIVVCERVCACCFYSYAFEGSTCPQLALQASLLWIKFG